MNILAESHRRVHRLNDIFVFGVIMEKLKVYTGPRCHLPGAPASVLYILAGRESQSCLSLLLWAVCSGTCIYAH